MYNQRIYNFLIIFIILKLFFSLALKDNNDDILENSSFLIIYNISDFLIICALCILFVITIKSQNILIIGIIILIIALRLIIDVSYKIDTIKSISSSLKLTLPLLLFIILKGSKISFNNTTNSLKIISIVVIALSIYAYVYLPNSMNRGETFWPVYFSGLHTQAYTLLSIGIFLIILNIENQKKIYAIIIYLCIFLTIYSGYNVRTACFSFLIFSIIYFIISVKNNSLKTLSIIVLLSGILYSAIFTVLQIDIRWDTFTSGRSAMYLVKYNEIVNRSFIEFLFGSGTGTDMIYSNIWWWEAKGAHNDYLTILIEGGLINLTLIIYLFRLIFQSFKNPYSISIFLMYMASSTISNGYLYRPLPSYILVLVLYWLESKKQLSLSHSKI